MKLTIIVLLILLGLLGSAFAGWVWVDHMNDKSGVTYINGGNR